MIKIVILCLFTSVVFGQVVFSQSKSIEQLLHNGSNPEEMPEMSTREAVTHTDSVVYIRDTIYGSKVINSSLTVLYVGGKYPRQVLTVLIKGKETNSKLKFIRKGIGHFTGKVTNYKGKPTIIITNTYQVGTRIQI